MCKPAVHARAKPPPLFPQFPSTRVSPFSPSPGRVSTRVAPCCLLPFCPASLRVSVAPCSQRRPRRPSLPHSHDIIRRRTRTKSAPHVYLHLLPCSAASALSGRAVCRGTASNQPASVSVVHGQRNGSCYLAVRLRCRLLCL